jgi:hypothetical protein
MKSDMMTVVGALKVFGPRRPLAVEEYQPEAPARV